MITKYFNELQRELGRNTGKYLSNKFLGEFGWATPRRYEVSGRAPSNLGETAKKLELRAQELQETKKEDEERRLENREFVQEQQVLLELLQDYHKTVAKLLDWSEVVSGEYAFLMGHWPASLKAFFVSADDVKDRFDVINTFRNQAILHNLDCVVNDNNGEIKDSWILDWSSSSELESVNEVVFEMFGNCIVGWRFYLQEKLGDEASPHKAWKFVATETLEFLEADVERLNERVNVLREKFLVIASSGGFFGIQSRLMSMFGRENIGETAIARFHDRVMSEFVQDIKRTCMQVMEQNHDIGWRMSHLGFNDLKLEYFLKFFEVTGYFDRFHDAGLDLVVTDFTDPCLSVDLIINTDLTVPRTEFETIYNDSRLKEEVMPVTRRNSIIYGHVTSLTIALLCDLANFNHPNVRTAKIRVFLPGNDMEDVLAIRGDVQLSLFRTKDWKHASGKELEALESIEMDFGTRSGFKSVAG